VKLNICKTILPKVIFFCPFYGSIFLSLGLIPREDNASDHVLKVLEPFSVVNGGPLEIEVGFGFYFDI
jgi:hypothetical protein